MSDGKFSFSALNKAQADKIMAKYPEVKKASAVMPLLDLAQRQNAGYLSEDAMNYVAGLVGLPPVKVYEVATFYTMYNVKPVGLNHVQVCTNLPCWLRGSDEIAHAVKDSLGLGFGETSADGKFTLAEVECLGACCNAPMIQINDDYYEDLTPESVVKILEALKKGDVPKPGSQKGRVGSEPFGGFTTLKGEG